MWLHETWMRRLGFRRQGPAYWVCFRRFGLVGDEHISTYARSEIAEGGHRRGPSSLIVEVTEFHVTLPLGENVHFYYHESEGRSWPPGGHTSAPEVRRLGLEPAELRARADRVARAFVDALGDYPTGDEAPRLSPATRPRRPRRRGRS